MRRLVWCLALASLVAACGSSARVSTPGSTTSVPTPPSSVLRGVSVPSLECSRGAASSSVSPVPIQGVQAFLLCPLGTPGQPSKAITIIASNPLFEVLVRALSAADVPPTSGAVCPAYADLTQVVLAKTTGHAYQVSIPTDSCGHYQHDALDALHRARGV